MRGGRFWGFQYGLRTSSQRQQKPVHVGVGATKSQLRELANSLSALTLVKPLRSSSPPSESDADVATLAGALTWGFPLSAVQYEDSQPTAQVSLVVDRGESVASSPPTLCIGELSSGFCSEWSVGVGVGVLAPHWQG